MYKYAGILHKKMPVFFMVSELLVKMHKETKKLLEINSFISVSNINNGNPFSIMNVSVNQIKIGNKISDNDIEELNLKKGAIIHGNFGYTKDEYTKIQSNE